MPGMQAGQLLPLISERGSQFYGRGGGGQIMPSAARDRWESRASDRTQHPPRSKSTPLGYAHDLLRDHADYDRDGRGEFEDSGGAGGKKGAKSLEEIERERHDRHYVPPPKVPQKSVASVYGVGGGGFSKAKRVSKTNRREHAARGEGGKRMSDYDKALFSQISSDRLPWVTMDGKPRGGAESVARRQAGTAAKGGKGKAAGRSGSGRAREVGGNVFPEDDESRAAREEEEEWRALYGESGAGQALFERLESDHDRDLYQQLSPLDTDGHIYNRLRGNRHALCVCVCLSVCLRVLERQRASERASEREREREGERVTKRARASE